MTRCTVAAAVLAAALTIGAWHTLTRIKHVDLTPPQPHASAKNDHPPNHRPVEPIARMR
jgi:hypothetical protein